MSVQHNKSVTASRGAGQVVRRLVGPGIVGGLLGGLALIVVMILVMGAKGMGYATPLNLGMPAFVFTITPPPDMMPNLMTMMGIHLPASAMSKFGPAIQSGHVTPAMANQLGTMLMGMGVPAAKVKMMGALMTGHATNNTVVALMSQMSPHARAMMMAAMPVSAGRVVVGAILHFAYSAFLGILFAIVIGVAAWLRVPVVRTAAGVIVASIIGGAIVYVVMRWGLLPPTNPMMGFVPQIAFFLAHLLYGLVVGIALAMALRRPTLRRALSTA